MHVHTCKMHPTLKFKIIHLSNVFSISFNFAIHLISSSFYICYLHGILIRKEHSQLAFKNRTQLVDWSILFFGVLWYLYQYLIFTFLIQLLHKSCAIFTFENFSLKLQQPFLEPQQRWFGIFWHFGAVPQPRSFQ